ncbi:MAG TPA: hypothetical protein DCM07_10855 [Planctomycetaceae bacterium]|nr:hypothetical protein [Gimesia sp.]HAH45330.1 hypothetical protein [Planctomycetaceae bacterium]HBL42898.1 hypothetical protein [Planctomycetaceae bacterium]
MIPDAPALENETEQFLVNKESMVTCCWRRLFLSSGFDSNRMKAAEKRGFFSRTNSWFVACCDSVVV